MPAEPARKAKLFLSCGQNSSFGEPEWAKQVESKLTELGFEVFYAVEERNGRSLTENIFAELREADYYLFIDFKREEIVQPRTRSKSRVARDKTTKLFRGSLFSHQEFAIACFQGLEMLAFREAGVEPLTGVIGAVMANAISFESRDELPNKVCEEVLQKLATSEWSKTSQNRLQITAAQDNGRIDEQTNPESHKVLRLSHYHINVANLHHRKAATNCFAYVEEILDLRTGVRVGPTYTCELKWEGTMLQGVRIGPESKRGVDSFIVLHEQGGGQRLAFRPQTDANNHIHYVDPGNELLVTYIVSSDEFPLARQKFRIGFSGKDSIVQVTQV